MIDAPVRLIEDGVIVGMIEGRIMLLSMEMIQHLEKDLLAVLSIDSLSECL